MTIRVTAISDVHGAADRIVAVAASCDVLLVLGDLINVLDYRTMDGILVEVFGREPVAEAARLRAEGRPDEARAVIRASVDPSAAADVGVRFVELARAEYERVFAAIPPGAFVTFGNADVPDLLRAAKPDGVHVVDAGTVQIGAWTFGFVGGGVRNRWSVGTPGELPEEEFDAALSRVGRVDVLCTHVPPRLPGYTYDVVARKFEPGSAALLGFVRRHRPRFALFGHVHNPLMDRGTVCATEMVNVGHFQAHGRGFSFDVPD
jgi:Icc-related predicted phosphoesterase